MEYDKKHCKIYYKDNIKTLIQKWNGNATFVEFKEAIDYTVNFFKNNKNVKYIISDVTNAGAATKESTDYTNYVANPQLADSGMKAIIFIVKKSARSNISVKRFIINAHELTIYEVLNMNSALKKIEEFENV